MTGGGKGLAQQFALKVILFTAAVVGIVSLIQVLVIYPRFVERMVRDSHGEAIRDGWHISRMIPVRRMLEEGVTDATAGDEMALLKKDFDLWKVKIFAGDGTVIYSSDRSEIGSVNRQGYFHEVVARGNSHSTTVWGKEVTLEGERVPRDVVETYIPIMKDGVFLGASEIYYDITARKKGIDRVMMQASVFTFGIGGMLLVIIGFLARKAEGAVRERERLEEQLIRSDRLAAIGTLVGGMAHEFNNINVTVMGFSQLALARSNLPPDLRDHLQRINRAAHRADSITNNLLDFTREGKAAVGRGSLSRACAEALAIIREQYAKEGIEIRDRVSPVPDSIMDEGQIVQATLNLCANARDAMSGSSRKELTVTTGSDGAMVFLSVADTGCGIAEADLAQVFSPFFSRKGEHATDRVQAANKGTGLGLSVCHTIVSNHGGDIHAESAVGSGTTFTIRLPVAGKGEGGDVPKETGEAHGVT
jgi:signal transduction histidine kinase